MTFHFLNRSGQRLFCRDDAISALHYCEDFAFEAEFPLRADRPLEVGMIIAWQDDDDGWEAHEIVSAEPDAYGDTVSLTGCHIALAELRDALLPEAKLDGAALPTAVDALLAGTLWRRGVLPSAAESDAVRRERYRVTTRVSRLNLRSGPGTRYKSLGLYRKGTYVTLIEKTNSSWYHVEAPDGRTGWMSTAYLTRDGSVEAAPEGFSATLSETWITAWAALESVASAAGLLILPRVTLTDAGLSERRIDLMTAQPEYRGVRLTCDSNIRQAGVKFDISRLYTSMTGLGKDDMTFADAVWSASGGDPADKPQGQDYVEHPAARALWGRSRRAVVRFPEETDAARLLARTWEQLTIASQPRVTISATIADLYPLGYGGQSMRLYDMVQVILRPIGLRLNARITGLTRDLIEPEKTRPVIGSVGASDIVQDVLSAAAGNQHIDSWQVRSIVGDSISPGTVGSAQLRDASIEYAKIAVAAVEQLAANAIAAVSAHIGQLVAGEIETNRLYADLAAIAVAQITTANIGSASIDWAAIHTLTAQVAQIAQAQINTATIDAADIRWADIDSLNAAVAAIAEARIGDAKITTAQISDLRAEIARFITLAAQDGKFDFASIRDLLAGAMILEEGVAGSVYIKNLVATRANFVGATLGELVLQGEDGGYYEVIVRADGSIRTRPVDVTEGEIAAGQTNDGRQIVATTANVEALNASDIRAESAILSEIFAGALRAGKISAQEAFLASATVPELRATALKSIGDTLDISANEQIRLLVTDVAQADARRRIFSEQPAPPYDVGDVWMQGADGDILRCRAAKAAGQSFAAADWAAASKYTGDAAANAALAQAAANATAIEQQAQQIALRATKTELSGVAETLRGEMTVSSDAIRAEVKAISVGGANLLPESGFWQRQPTAWTSAGGGCTLTGDVTYAGGKTLYTNAAAGGMQGPWVQIEPGRTYTYSAMIFSDGIDGARDRPLHFLATEDTSSTGQLVEFIEWQQAQPWHEWTLLWTTFRSTTATWFRPDVSGVDHSMYVAWLKLEEGNRPTAWTPNVEDPVRALMTSSIEILQNAIRILSGGDVSIGAGAALSIQSAATQIVTDVFNLSIGDENNRVCEFNRDTQRLSVTEVDADNVHPYINAPVTWRASEIGGIRELANRLRYCAYPSVTYIQDVDDYSASPVCFAGSLSPCVLIESDNWTSGGQRRVPPVVIQNSTGNWRMGNLTWNCAERAVSVECGVSLTMTHCWIYNANQGLTALYGGRITWENWIEHTGYCQDYMASATIGGEIKLGGYVPGGTVTPGATGWVQNKSAALSGTASTPATQSAALTGTLGWISAKKSWTSGLAYQGYTTGKGECYGCFQFTLPAAAASIRSATLTLRRKSGTGKGAEVDIHLYGSATAWGSRPTLGTLYASRTDAVLAGRSVSLDVTSAAQALLAGSIRQLVAYEGDGRTMANQVYSTDYCAWDEATLDVTYTT